jgi:plasmid stability protein
MASLLIRNLPESTKTALKQRAAANGRSMEEEARQILDLEFRRDRSLPREGLGTRIRRIFVESGAVGELEIPPRSGKMRKPPFVTDEEWEGR